MQADRRSWISKNYMSFNGLRGLAVLLVFVNHYGAAAVRDVFVHQLWFGVDIFFVLSGFLITGILYDAKSSEHYFKNFYIRRALRIFPLYYGFFLAFYALAPALHFALQPYFWTNLLYASNIVRLVVNPTFAVYVPYNSIRLTFGHLWSLCVEEQFYLVWPLVIWALPTRQSMMRVSLLAAAASMLLRILLFFTAPATNATVGFLYWFTPTRCEGLLLGAWVALWLRGTHLSRYELRRTALWLIVPSVSVLVLGAATIGKRWANSERNPLLVTYGYTLVDVACVGLLLLALDEQGKLSRALRNRWLGKLGVISYGFYFFHGILVWPLFILHDHFADRPHAGLVFLAGSFAANVTLASLSYNLWERKFLKLKDRFAPSHRSVPSGDEVHLLSRAA